MELGRFRLKYVDGDSIPMVRIWLSPVLCNVRYRVKESNPLIRIQNLPITHPYISHEAHSPDLTLTRCPCSFPAQLWLGHFSPYSKCLVVHVVYLTIIVANYNGIQNVALYWSRHWAITSSWSFIRPFNIYPGPPISVTVSPHPRSTLTSAPHSNSTVHVVYLTIPGYCNCLTDAPVLGRTDVISCSRLTEYIDCCEALCVSAHSWHPSSRSLYTRGPYY